MKPRLKWICWKNPWDPEKSGKLKLFGRQRHLQVYWIYRVLFFIRKLSFSSCYSTETTAGGHQGLSASAAISHQNNYSVQSPRYIPSATSSPQPYHTGPVCGYSSSKARSPLTTPAENPSGFYSPGIITSPTQCSKIHLWYLTKK